MAELEAQKYSAEIQLQNAKQLYDSDASEVSVYQTIVDQLASKLSEMRVGQDTKANAFVPTNIMPNVALQYLRLMREVEIQSKLKAYLLPAYEQAKLDQSKNLYGFVTLDTASVPVHKAGSHRSIILIEAMVGSMVLTSTLLLLLSGVKRLRLNFARERKQIGV